MLNIEPKEDSAEKLAAIAGKPTKHYLYAPEFNQVVAAINSLAANPAFSKFTTYINPTVVDGVFTAPANQGWEINAVAYTNPANVTFPIVLAAAGLKRFDAYYATADNTFVKISSEESANPIIPTDAPANSLLYSVILVTDSLIGTPTEPAPGPIYQTKAEKGDAVYSLGAFEYISAIEASRARITYQTTGFLKAIRTWSGNISLYTGKDYTVKNESGAPLTLKHLDATLTGLDYKKFWFPNATDLVLQNGETANFVYSNGRFELDSSNQIGLTVINTDITSTVLDKQDLSGFVAYINSLGSSFFVPHNCQHFFTVTDTNQVFLLKGGGRSFGGSSPDILVTDVVELNPSNIWDHVNFANWRVLRADALGGNQSAITFSNGLNFLNDGTATIKPSTYNTGDFKDTVRRVGITSASTVGSSCGRRVTSGISCSTKSGFYFCADTMSEDNAAVATAADFVGLGATFSTAFGNAEPSTATSCILLAYDSTDSTMQVMHNDSTGVCTKVPLGVNFPKNTISADLYRIEEFCFPNGTRIYYRVTRLNTGHVSAGVITSNIPGPTIPLTLGFWRGNLTTPLTVCKSFSQISIATQY